MQMISADFGDQLHLNTSFPDIWDYAAPLADTTGQLDNNRLDQCCPVW